MPHERFSVSEELVRLSRKAPYAVAPRVLTQMIEDYQSRGEPLPSDADLLQHAARKSRMAINELEREQRITRSRPRRRSARRPIDVEIDAELIRRARRLLETQSVAISAIRDRLFPSRADMPTSLEDSVTFIEARTRAERSLADVARDAAPIDQIYREAEKVFEAHPWVRFHCGVKYNFVEYFDRDGTTENRHVNRVDEPAFWDACTLARRFAESTHLRPELVLIHILTGMWPGDPVILEGGVKATLPGFQLYETEVRPTRIDERPNATSTSDSPASVSRLRVSVKIDVDDISDRVWRQIRQEIRKDIQSGRGNRANPRPTSKQKRIVELVTELGGPPSVRHDQTFWEQVRRQWNRTAARPAQSYISLVRLYERSCSATSKAENTSMKRQRRH